MSFTKSYFNGSIALPNGNGINLKSTNGNAVTIISSTNTSNSYTLVLPQNQGTLQQRLAIDSISNNNINQEYDNLFIANIENIINNIE